MAVIHRLLTLAAPAAVAAVVAAAVAPAAAGAATPAPDAEYAGSTSQRQDITLATSGTERVRRIRLSWRIRNCDRARHGVQGTGTLRRAAVRDGGHFSERARRRQRIPASRAFGGGTQVVRYRLRGRFIRDDLARGVVRIAVVVRNRAGQEVDTCETRRAIRWRAALLGVGPDGPEV